MLGRFLFPTRSRDVSRNSVMFHDVRHVKGPLVTGGVNRRSKRRRVRSPPTSDYRACRSAKGATSTSSGPGTSYWRDPKTHDPREIKEVPFT